MTNQTSEKNKKYESQKSEQFGYIVEWKFKEGTAAVAMNPNNILQMPSSEWSKAPYDINDVLMPPIIEGRDLIRPVIQKWDKQLAQYQLVRKNVAIAISACLLTSLPEELINHTEWRFSKMRLNLEHAIHYTEEISNDTDK